MQLAALLQVQDLRHAVYGAVIVIPEAVLQPGGLEPTGIPLATLVSSHHWHSLLATTESFEALCQSLRPAPIACEALSRLIRIGPHAAIMAWPDMISTHVFRCTSKMVRASDCFP